MNVKKDNKSNPELIYAISINAVVFIFMALLNLVYIGQIGQLSTPQEYTWISLFNINGIFTIMYLVGIFTGIGIAKRIQKNPIKKVLPSDKYKR